MEWEIAVALFLTHALLCAMVITMAMNGPVAKAIKVSEENEKKRSEDLKERLDIIEKK